MTDKNRFANTTDPVAAEILRETRKQLKEFVLSMEPDVQDRILGLLKRGQLNIVNLLEKAITARASKAQ